MSCYRTTGRRLSLARCDGRTLTHISPQTRADLLSLIEVPICIRPEQSLHFPSSPTSFPAGQIFCTPLNAKSRISGHYLDGYAARLKMGLPDTYELSLTHILTKN